MYSDKILILFNQIKKRNDQIEALQKERDEKIVHALEVGGWNYNAFMCEYMEWLKSR